MPTRSFVDTKKKIQSLNLSVVVLDALKRIARLEDRSLSYVADQMLLDAIKQKEQEAEPA